MLKSAATYPSCNDSEPENNSGLVKPLSFSSQSARPHFLLRERRLPLCLAISAVSCCQGCGALQALTKPGDAMENPFLQWKCWAGPNPRAVPEGLPGAGVAAVGQRGGWVGGQAWVGEARLLFDMLSKPPGRWLKRELSLENCSAFCKGRGSKVGWARVGNMFKLSVISGQSESVSKFGGRACFW